MIPEKTIEELISKHANLEKELSSGLIDKKTFAEKSKEYSDLNEIIQDAKKYISYKNDKLEQIKNNHINKCTNWCVRHKQPYYKTIQQNNIFLSSNN